MAENETNEVQETKDTGGGSGARTAMKAAAAAAVTGAAAMAARKKLSSNGKSTNGISSAAKNVAGKGRDSSTLLTSIASGGWDAARDAVIPLAEDAAGAAGTYLAKNGPDFVKDKIVPRFISSFNEAKGD